MSNYTKGPWHPRRIGSKGDIGIYMLSAPFSAGCIARVPFTENKPVRENAQLLAAAPELAEALLAMVNDAQDIQKPAYQQALGALAKAGL